MLTHSPSHSHRLWQVAGMAGRGGGMQVAQEAHTHTHTHTHTHRSRCLNLYVRLYVCMSVSWDVTEQVRYVRSFPQLGSSIQRSKRRFILSSLKILFLGEKLFLVQQSKWKRVRL
jgi:hypothetical protein